jgi:2-polyprenyl-3-methyl-5-hydroxy-6-metoxy-1,4-benzoquinol methylase
VLWQSEVTLHVDSPCWVCDSDDVSPWRSRGLDRALIPHDLRITDDRYGTTLSLLRCRKCGFIFADGDELDRLTSLYEELADPGYDDSHEPRLLQMRWLLDVALQQTPGARTLLDVGAASGLLAAEAAALGLDATGIEPSRALVEAARRVHGVELVHGVLPHPELAERRFDLVCLVDVLEHVADPVALLECCADRLAPGGTLVLVTPDVSSLAARVLGDRWWHFRLAHVGYFDGHTLEHAVRKAGLAVREQQRARWFYSVDYLATRLERYVPVGGLNRVARGGALGRWLYECVAPFNLYDSCLVLATRADDEGDDGVG